MKTIHLLRELKSYLLLWSTQAVSALGTAMTEYALTVWVYEQEGTASSIALLTLCSFAPTILLRFIAGAAADRWDQKRIMLFADVFAAFGTLSICLLHASSALRIWQLYIIHILLSIMNAFQEPAAFAAASRLVKKEHYARIGGLQGFSGAAVAIAAPSLGAAVLAFGGLTAVLICDLCSFAAAFLVLLFFIRIPANEKARAARTEPFHQTCMEGFRFLRSHTVLLRLILFMACVNLLAKIGSDGMLAPFVLSRTGDDQQALGLVQSCISLGVMTGSVLVAWMKPVQNRLRLIVITTAIVFSGSIIQSLSALPWVWCAAAFGTYAVAAVMNVHLTAYLREQVPPDMQGRVFSAESTLKNGFIPLGLFAGGLLADHVFEPFMAADSPLQKLLVPLFGAGKGSGLALQFFIAGSLGILLCLTHLRKAAFRKR